MRQMHAFDPLAHFVARVSSKVRHVMFCNGVLSLIGNAVLADEMAQIVTVGPIIKEIAEDNIEGSEKDMYKIKCREIGRASCRERV